MTNAGVMLLCRIAADSLNVVLFIVVSRAFGPEGVGTYSYAFAVAGLAYALTTLGIDEYGIREYQRITEPQRRHLIAELLGLQLVLAAGAIIALALYLLVTAPDRQTIIIVCSLSAYQLASALAATLFVPAMAEQNMMRPALIVLVTRAAAFGAAAAALLAAEASLAIALLVFPLTGCYLIGSAVQSARAHLPRLGIHFARNSIRRLSHALWSFATAEVFGQLLTRAGVIVLSLQLGERAAGVYATGLKFIEVAFLPLWFLGVAAYPALCRHFHGDPARFGTLSSQLLWATLVMSGTVAAVLYFILPPLLVPILGDGYAGAQAYIAAMAIIALLHGPELGLGRILFASHGHAHRAAALACGAVLCIVLNVMLIPRFGMNGAIYATAGAYLAAVVLYGFGLRFPLREQALQRASASP